MSDIIINENPAADSSRDAKGQFAPGNKGGPGNPFGGKVANFRKVVLACVTPEDIRQIVKSLMEMAMNGNFNAAKLILLYAIGKPEQLPPPESLDWDEPPSTNGEIQERGGEIPILPIPDEQRQDRNLAATGSAPSTNGDFVTAPPSTNGNSQTLNRKQRRKLMKAQRIAARHGRGVSQSSANSPVS